MGADGHGKPLDGVRILDLSQVAIGPYATFLLASLGAQVIKVESHRRADITRGAVTPVTQSQINQYPDGEPGERPWNRTAFFNQRNRGKLGVTLDFSVPAGKDLLIRLAAVCDALVENFRASVLDRQGIGWEVLREVNPRLIYLKLSSQGASGPERDYGSLGSTLEQTAGLASITGYLDGPPLMTNETYPDPVAGVLGVGALIAALRRVRRTGNGEFIDLSQREATAGMLGEALMDYAINGRVAAPLGNRHRSAAPHGVYPCSGTTLEAIQASAGTSSANSGGTGGGAPDRKGLGNPPAKASGGSPSQEGSEIKPPDEWIAIAVQNDEQWQGLRRVMGDPEWSRDARFETVTGRWQNQDELDAHLAAWTAGYEHRELTHLLQQQGVPAGAVLDGVEVLADPQLVARGWWDQVTPTEVGRPFPMITPPWRMSGAPYTPMPPAPVLGEHNDLVYQQILGLSEEEYRTYQSDGVISTEAQW